MISCQLALSAKPKLTLQSSPGGDRTLNPRIRNPMLIHLSFGAKIETQDVKTRNWSAMRELNPPILGGSQMPNRSANGAKNCGRSQFFARLLGKPMSVSGIVIPELSPSSVYGATHNLNNPFKEDIACFTAN